MNHKLTEKSEEIIVQMLYEEVQEILRDYFGDNLNRIIREVYYRKMIRKWLKNPTPDWIYKERSKDLFEQSGKIWALRHEYEHLIGTRMVPGSIKEWGDKNLFDTFYDCSFVTNGKANRTYKSDRDEDIVMFRMTRD